MKIPNYEDQNADIEIEDFIAVTDKCDFVKVPRDYLMRMLKRLKDLQSLDNKYLAEADIPETKMYLFSGIKIKKTKGRINQLTRQAKIK